MKILLLGATLDTGNMGVNALSISIIENLVRKFPDVEIVIADHSNAELKNRKLALSNGDKVVSLTGCTYSQIFFKKQGLLNAVLQSFFGLRNSNLVREFIYADAIFDITGGDSFTDLYGRRRFVHVTRQKKLALKFKKKLYLLPQTYGPFSSKRRSAIAGDIINKAEECWARDINSYEKLKMLAKINGNAVNCKLGVDVAFSLPVRKPKVLPETLEEWFNSSEQVIGLNISGLVYNDEAQKKNFGHIANYKVLIHELVEKLIKKGTKLVFVPHVLVPKQSIESDTAASLKVLESMPPEVKRNIFVIPENYDQSELKWIISQLKWFCGTRMHATIASLSSNVPTCTIAYSLKAEGVFGSCGLSNQVFDLRHLHENEIIDGVLDSYDRRKELRDILQQEVPKVISQAQQQFDEIFQSITNQE